MPARTWTSTPGRRVTSATWSRWPRRVASIRARPPRRSRRRGRTALLRGGSPSTRPVFRPDRGSAAARRATGLPCAARGIARPHASPPLRRACRDRVTAPGQRRRAPRGGTRARGPPPGPPRAVLREDGGLERYRVVVREADARTATTRASPSSRRRRSPSLGGRTTHSSSRDDAVRHDDASRA